MNRSRFAVVACVAALSASVVAACGSDPDTVETDDPQSGSSSADEDEEPQGKILESGFGQSGDYIWVTALVENLSDHGGQTVTLSFNLLNAAGDVVGTQSQVESFNIAGQKLAVGTQVDAPAKQEVAAVEPTLLIEDDGTFEEAGEDLGAYDATSITPIQYSDGQFTAKFPVENVTDRPLKSPRIGVICHGQDGKVNGGHSEYPDLIPPSGSIVLDSDVMTSGKPKSCTAYVASGM